MNYPLDKNLVDNVCTTFGLMDAHELGNATIRQMVGIIREIERQADCEYVHMELGNPGLPSEQIGVEAQIEALRNGCANKYPLITGIPELTKAASEFVRAFLGLNVPEECIVPTVGSMQGCYALDTLISQLRPDRDTILFLDPCFPVQKQQSRVIGLKVDSIDIGDYRGDSLRDALEQKLQKGNISAILYSNPNNPSWMCLTEYELRIIGQLANRYDTIVIEDVAYLNMDFRDPNRGKPYCAPFQPSVGRYTMNCVHLVSCSKIFSYAGERAAVIAVNPDLAHRHFPALTKRYNSDGQFMRTLVYQILYAISSGVSHSVQYAMAAMMKAACEGRINFVQNTRVYAERAHRIKQIMEKHHFHVVYDKDADNRPVGDGFFFTFTYRDWTGEQLLNKIIYYGVSAISLVSTGAKREGMRGCAASIRDDQFDALDERLALFDRDFAPASPNPYKKEENIHLVMKQNNTSASFIPSERGLGGVVSPQEAVSLIQSGDTIVVQGSTSVPFVLLRALTERASELRDVRLISGFGIYPEDAPYAKPEYVDSFRALSIFVPNYLRRAMKTGLADTIPCFLGEVPFLFRSGQVPVDAVFLNVSEPDENGYCSYGISADIAFSAAECAKKVIAQVNKFMPRTFGDPVIHVSQITAMCRGDEPLVEVPTPVPNETESRIGHFIAEQIPDGATLQIGVGGIPNAVINALGGHKHLGLHTEAITDGVLPLIEKGVIDNSMKALYPGKSVGSLVLGSRHLYDHIDGNPDFIIRDVAWTNDPQNIRQNPKAMAINSAVEIDLTGQICADSIGETVISGVGGQHDFMYGAALSEGGKCFIAMPSMTDKGQSKIVSHLQPGAGVVTTRFQAQYIVTEQGIVYLRNLPLAERAKALISIAHPSVREDLEREAVRRFGIGFLRLR